MLIVSEEWKAAYPGASAGILVMRDLCNPARHPALEARRLQVEEALRGRFGGMDRARLVATAPLDAYSVYFKRFKKTYPVQLQLESVVFKDRHIPNFSALVTSMFTAELKNQLLTAGHDLDSLRLPVMLRVADGTESFTLITGAEQGLKAGDMYMSDAAGIISVVVYGPDQRTRITPDTRNALFTVYAPPGVDPAAVQAHLEDIRDNVLLVAPDATLERLEVHQGGVGWTLRYRSGMLSSSHLPAMDEKEEAGMEEKEEAGTGAEVPWSLVPDEEKNITRCNCPGCPSSPDDGTTLYCARGLSPLRVRTVGCICTSCPVYRVYELQDGYFCAVEPARWDNMRRP